MGVASWSLALAMMSAARGDGSEYRLAQKLLVALPSASVQRDIAEGYWIVMLSGGRTRTSP